MKLYENEPVEAVPAGFERLSELRDRIGAGELMSRVQLAKVDTFELVIEDGTVRRVAVEDWCSEYASAMMASGRKYHRFSPELPADPADPRDVGFHGTAGRLLLVKKMQIENIVTTAGREKGRPPAEAWADVAAAAAIYLYESGPPKTANELVKHIQERCNDAIGETTTKAFVSKLLLAINGIVKK